MLREQLFDHYRSHPDIPVLIIGAGVNGIGTFRDLALQGVDVLLIDRADFCSGASMASSHMLHGGIRYLENGEFRLVREALHERNRLLRNAPHLTKPLPTTIPIFKVFSGILNAPLKFLGLLDKPSERGMLVIKIGLMVYDAYVRGDSPMPGYTVRGRAESLWTWPELNPDIRYTATYYDGAMPSPERICMEMIADGETAHPMAHAVNYLSAVGVNGDAVTLRDEVSGGEIDVRPQVIVNAAGPWIDFVNQRIDGDTRIIGGTKGSHIIVDHPDLRKAIGENEFFFEYFDGRIVLIYPYEDKVMLGTTDIPIDNPDEARCTDEEIDYILGMVPHVFPDLNVGREHIVFQFSGVRPLPTSDADSPGQVSRDHSIEVVPPGDDLPVPILSLVGGKWTSFRAFSEEVADDVLARLGRERQQSTTDEPIGGGRDYPTTEAAREAYVAGISDKTRVPAARVATLFERYGTGAETVAAYIADGDDAPLSELPDYSRRELAFLATQEKVVHLDDLPLRRSLIAWLGDLSPGLAAELSEVAGEALGWSAEKRKEELARMNAILHDEHGLALT